MTKAEDTAQRLIKERMGANGFLRNQLAAIAVEAYETGFKDGNALADDAWESAQAECEETNNRLTAALEDIRNHCGRPMGVPFGDAVKKVVDEVIGKKKPSPTLKELREACPMKWTLEQMDWMYNREFGGGPRGYSDCERGEGDFTLDSPLANWLAEVFNITPEAVYAASQESIKVKNNERGTA